MAKLRGARTSPEVCSTPATGLGRAVGRECLGSCAASQRNLRVSVLLLPVRCTFHCPTNPHRPTLPPSCTSAQPANNQPVSLRRRQFRRRDASFYCCSGIPHVAAVCPGSSAGSRHERPRRTSVPLSVFAAGLGCGVSEAFDTQADAVNLKEGTHPDHGWFHAELSCHPDGQTAPGGWRSWVDGARRVPGAAHRTRSCREWHTHGHEIHKAHTHTYTYTHRGMTDALVA